MLFVELLAVADRLDVDVRFERLGDEETPAESGIVRLEGRQVIFLDSRLTREEAVQVLARELSAFRFDDIHMKPAVRKLLARNP